MATLIQIELGVLVLDFGRGLGGAVDWLVAAHFAGPVAHACRVVPPELVRRLAGHRDLGLWAHEVLAFTACASMKLN